MLLITHTGYTEEEQEMAAVAIVWWRQATVQWRRWRAKGDDDRWQHRHKDEHRQRNCGLHVRAKIMGRNAAAAIALCAQWEMAGIAATAATKYRLKALHRCFYVPRPSAGKILFVRRSCLFPWLAKMFCGVWLSILVLLVLRSFSSSTLKWKGAHHIVPLQLQIMRQMASPTRRPPLPLAASSCPSRTLKNVAYLYDSHSINNEHFYLPMSS